MPKKSNLDKVFEHHVKLITPLLREISTFQNALERQAMQTEVPLEKKYLVKFSDAINELSYRFADAFNSRHPSILKIKIAIIAGMARFVLQEFPPVNDSVAPQVKKILRECDRLENKINKIEWVSI